MKTQIRRRVGMAPPGAWGKWAPNGLQKKNGAAGAGENWGPLKSENDLERVNPFFFFLFEIVRQGGPERVREGGPERSRKKPMGFLGYREKGIESFGRGGLERVREGG